ncbi:MAG: hypothetical protein ACRDGF_06800 [Chloroflexota bacterium]
MDVATFLRQQREANDSELRNAGTAPDIASRALRVPFEARAHILAWLVENRLGDTGALVSTLQAVVDQREAIPNVAAKIAANEAGYLLRRWRWFNPAA